MRMGHRLLLSWSLAVATSLLLCSCHGPQPFARDNHWRVAEKPERLGYSSAKLAQAQEYNEGPCVVVAEVVKEDNVFPMIPAGAPLTDIIIDAPKHKLEKPTGST